MYASQEDLNRQESKYRKKRKKCTVLENIGDTTRKRGIRELRKGLQDDGS